MISSARQPLIRSAPRFQLATRPCGSSWKMAHSFTSSTSSPRWVSLSRSRPRALSFSSTSVTRPGRANMSSHLGSCSRPRKIAAKPTKRARSFSSGAWMPQESRAEERARTRAAAPPKARVSFVVPSRPLPASTRSRVASRSRLPAEIPSTRGWIPASPSPRPDSRPLGRWLGRNSNPVGKRMRSEGTPCLWIPDAPRATLVPDRLRKKGGKSDTQIRTVKRPEAGALREGSFGGIRLVGFLLRESPEMGTGQGGGTNGGGKLLGPAAPKGGTGGAPRFRAYLVFL